MISACSCPSDSTPTTSEPASALAATAESDWAVGLATGPNGPIPAIVVDQFGYRTTSEKVAVLRRPVTGFDAGSDFTPGDDVQLVDAATGTVVESGPASAWNDGAEDSASGDLAWWFDFSGVTQPGRYFVADPANGVRSPQFEIRDDVYGGVLRAALRTFFYQRAGQAKPAELAGSAWADGASHLGPGQDIEARSWLAKKDPTTARDLRGGWYDAGDYNKYTAWHANYLIALLHTYHEHPDLVGDDLGIPESGNGVSDLLDEISWGLSWLSRMQDTDGSVLCVQGLSSASPPSAATGPSYYGPATTNATLKAAAAFAYAATVYADSGSSALAGQANVLTRQARSAWDWAEANPALTYYNNDEDRQPGSGGLAAGQQEPDERGRAASKVEAAVYLYGQTQDRQFTQYVEANRLTYLPAGSQSQWTVTEQETMLHYASLPGVTPEVSQEIRSDYLAAITSGAEFMRAVEGAVDPYRSPIAMYTWGSNQSKAVVGRMFALAQAYELDPQVAQPALAAAEGYVHYLHGVNPLGLAYLTTMQGAGAEHPASTLFHLWFAPGTRWDSVTPQTPGPAPGFLVGGPNPQYQIDRCCAESPACGGTAEAAACSANLSPPLGQPPMKSFLQFNDGWPANSWEVTENSNGYQVQFIRLLSSFVA